MDTLRKLLVFGQIRKIFFKKTLDCLVLINFKLYGNIETKRSSILMKMTDVDLFMTPSELASLLNLSVQGLYKQLKESQIDTKKANGRHKIYPYEMRKFIEYKRLFVPNSVIALHIVKGGVGKTTIAHGLASRASAYGFKTLMVDLDQQANLSSTFGIYTEPKKDPTLLDVIMGHINGRRITVREAVVPITDFLHIVPSNLTIANLDLQLIQGTENITNFFEELFEPIREDYDLIFIDCPPALSRVTAAAHCFADRILMPVNTDRFSIDGLELTLDHLSIIQKKFDADPDLCIVINKFDARQKILGNAVIDALTSKYREFLMETYISVSKQIDNNIAAHKSIWASKSSKNPALEDLDNLLIELFQLDAWAKDKKIRGEVKQLQGEMANV